MKILIDAGFSGKRVEELLHSIDICPTSIDAIFVTHEHIDHVKGVGILSRRYNLPIYANANTWQGMTSIIGNIKEENIRIFKTEEFFDIKDLTIYPIGIFHDALEPVGYIIHHKNIKISVITDTGWVNDKILKGIKNSDLYLLESNHDIDMLKSGRYPWPLKQRIMSTRGHLSNDDAGRILGNILQGNEETVILGHLSKDNNIPELALNTVANYLQKEGLSIESDIKLHLSFRDKASKIYSL